MYPLTLLRISRNKVIELELKNNDSVSGLLYKCDMGMNLHLKNVTIMKEGGASLYINDCYLKGSSIKLARLDPKVLLQQKEEE
jgi:U6 snRNA-associated Sm-like protein LSm4